MWISPALPLCSCVCVLSRSGRLFVTPGTVACQAPLSMGFPCLPFPPPGDLPHPGITLMSPASPALAGGFFNLSHQGNPSLFLV